MDLRNTGQPLQDWLTISNIPPLLENDLFITNPTNKANILNESFV